MGDAPPLEGDGVGRIQKTWCLMILRGRFMSLPMNKTAKPNLVILEGFVFALGL